jgi:hypothetical protein
MLDWFVSATSGLMDTEALAAHLELSRRLATDIDKMVERRRAALERLERAGSDTGKARHFLDVAEDLQRKIWADKEQLEKELQDLQAGE